VDLYKILLESIYFFFLVGVFHSRMECV